MNSYIRIEFNQPNVSRIYVDSNSKLRYFNGDTLHKSDFTVKAELSNYTERTLSNFTSSLFETTLNTSITSITITAQIGTITGYSCSSTIYVFPWGKLNKNYIHNGTNPQQTFDIYRPAITENNQTFPVVVTIHGGGFDGGQKEDYNYITPFIINNGCIHVNMNYRLMPQNPTIGYSYYSDMLNDIGLLISHLNNNASTYHIDISKVILMGHSAGGNLALSYGLRNYVCQDNNSNNVSFKAIITEGAVSFSEVVCENDTIHFKSGSLYVNDTQAQIDVISDLTSLLGIGNNNQNSLSLNDIQPFTLLDINNNIEITISDLDNVILLQGIGFAFGDANQVGDGDTLIPFQDAQIFKYVSGGNTRVISVNGCSHNNYSSFLLNNYLCDIDEQNSGYATTLTSILQSLIGNNS